MNRSIFERVFPHAPSSVLPQYHDQDDLFRAPSAALSPPRISLKESSYQTPKSSPSESPRGSLKAAPISASVVHHDDPFLPVERTAKSLERNIQAFLDAQTEGLNASIGGDDDLSSVGSPTPTPSIATPTRSHAGLKTVPIRQPPSKKITLRGARKGLARAMENFAQLKDEEMRIIDTESRNRDSALQQTRIFEDKRQSLQTEIDSISSEDSATGSASLRAEASKVDAEIQELENRLFELRSRHRHLITQADQLDNSIDSNLSSYKSSLALIERDVKQFLRTPPVSCSLPNFDEIGSTRAGIYALKPERRTLKMAQEHWTTEQNSLVLRRADVEDEREALEEGARLWRDVTQQIADYEKDLRRALNGSLQQANGDINPAGSLLDKINDLIASVTAALTTAESKEWNLLICALGAELEALQQGRILLGAEPEKPLLERSETNGTIVDDGPPADLLNGSTSQRSNSDQSLQDTLREFDDGTADKGKSPVRDNKSVTESEIGQDPWAPAIGNALAGAGGTHRDYRSESEDDEPGPDFLVEHS